MDHIGAKIKKLMQRRELTYEKLAKQAGIAKRTLELAISDPGGRTLATMEKIARTLGVSLVHLIEPAPLWEEEGTGPRKKVYARIDEKTLEFLKKRAEDCGTILSAYIDEILSQAARMYRVQCGECEGIFWVEREKPFCRCPYCGTVVEICSGLQPN
ncbi:helix-turn-helix domain-containing protein [Thermodesulfatator atlanticus]|uniref:helix-turn-helix domain-containing protein n=1 Tax=Thermodesulfatator atlanticus TaxID=501497 RepID=UPI0003B59FB9|nr:helix-turn-helix transcriptional regulator [Thermodesulfatator atlanticus]